LLSSASRDRHIRCLSARIGPRINYARRPSPIALPLSTLLSTHARAATFGDARVGLTAKRILTLAGPRFVSRNSQMPGVQRREPDFRAMIRSTFVHRQRGRGGCGATAPYRRRVCAPESIPDPKSSRSETAGRAGEYRRRRKDTIFGEARFDQRSCKGLAVAQQRPKPDDAYDEFVTRDGKLSTIGGCCATSRWYTGRCVVSGSSRLPETPAGSGRISTRHEHRARSDWVRGFTETARASFRAALDKWRET
jgi:hypothetical protein